ncbi:MAG: sterol desaturase family protein [Scytolyngbya sp. HA4215-MV1]|jgi:sterol desaturase/sphingolipid hydroxylase (fatty acid hydroxylase superfamily)|nr:sterol desaturase family protein [Scytolyngbya sp. HA4215-MV1]
MQTFAQFPVFAAFLGLLAWTITTQAGRTQLQSKSRADWWLDSAGLLIQGIAIPAFQVFLIDQVYRPWLSIPPGCLTLSPIVTFLVSFVLVDYLYYWNHRLLHREGLWQVHQVHHTVTQMDVLGTSRNTLWTSFLIVYGWVHPLLIYVLADPTAYLWGVSLTAGLDLWRHSQAMIPVESWLHRCLSPWLILPQDHAWHHSSQVPHCNYGANFKLWDRLHRTYDGRDQLPAAIGIATPFSLMQKLLFPFP